MESTEDFTLDEEMKQKSYSDLATRSFPGSVIYLILWFIIIITTSFYLIKPYFCLFFSLLFITSTVIRTGLIRNFDRIYSRCPTTWILTFFPMIWFSALLWGTFCSLAMVLPDFESVKVVTIIATAGLTSGGGAALAPNRILTIGLITALLVPSGLAMIFFSMDLSLTVYLFLLIYWGGTIFVTKTQHDEYWLSLKTTTKLKQLNTLDGLTGLKNKAFFDKILKSEFKTAIREHSSLSLLMIDIDHFKAVNDCYGHLVGDECLRMISKCLTKIIKRETDTVARFGGEEFTAILPGTNIDQSASIAEKIRIAVEDLKLNIPEEIVRFTISIGVSNIVPTPGMSDKALIDSADKALYEAKNNGRNQVKIGKKIIMQHLEKPVKKFRKMPFV